MRPAPSRARSTTSTACPGKPPRMNRSPGRRSAASIDSSSRASEAEPAWTKTRVRYASRSSCERPVRPPRTQTTRRSSTFGRQPRDQRRKSTRVPSVKSNAISSHRPAENSHSARSRITASAHCCRSRSPTDRSTTAKWAAWFALTRPSNSSTGGRPGLSGRSRSQAPNEPSSSGTRANPGGGGIRSASRFEIGPSGVSSASAPLGPLTEDAAGASRGSDVPPSPPPATTAAAGASTGRSATCGRRSGSRAQAASAARTTSRPGPRKTRRIRPR